MKTERPDRYPSMSSKRPINLGVVVARGGSKRFPGKNLGKLCGRPLIEYSIDAAKTSQLLDDFLVSTDEPGIAQVARDAGAPVPFLRPPELATDDIPNWSVALHATRQWEALSGCSADATVLLQATSPLRMAEDIDGCIRRFWDREADVCASVTLPHDSPYFNMVEPCIESPELVRPCKEEMVDPVHHRARHPVYALNGAVFVYRPSILDGLTSQFRVGRYVVYPMPRCRSVDIDEPEDLELAEWYMRRSSRQTG